MESMILLFLPVLIIVWYSVRQNKSSNTVKSSNPEFSRLLVACLGDRGKALRLIRFEMDKEPRISEKVATIRAFDRLKQDRSR